jgi:hypothetical protein
MPLGSSSAAPVTMPGPSALRKGVAKARTISTLLTRCDVRRSRHPFLSYPQAIQVYEKLKRCNILRKNSSNLQRLNVRERNGRGAAGKNYSLYFAVWPSFLFALASIFFFSDSDSLPFLTI